VVDQSSPTLEIPGFPEKSGKTGFSWQCTTSRPARGPQGCGHQARPTAPGCRQCKAGGPGGRQGRGSFSSCTTRSIFSWYYLGLPSRFCRYRALLYPTVPGALGKPPELKPGNSGELSGVWAGKRGRVLRGCVTSAVVLWRGTACSRSCLALNGLPLYSLGGSQLVAKLGSHLGRRETSLWWPSLKKGGQ